VRNREFSDDIGKQAVEAMMGAIPDEWKQYAMLSSTFYRGVGHFHRPGIVYALDLVVALPAQN
jgi:hypothetical protein